MSKKGLEGKGSVGYFLFFYVILFRVSGWIIQGSNTGKDMIGFLDHRCVLKCHFLLGLKQVLVGMESVPSIYSIIDLIHLSRACFESCWALTHHRSPSILSSWSITNSMWQGWQEVVDIHIARISSVHACLWSLARSNFTDKNPSSERK